MNIYYMALKNFQTPHSNQTLTPLTKRNGEEQFYSIPSKDLLPNLLTQLCIPLII